MKTKLSILLIMFLLSNINAQKILTLYRDGDIVKEIYTSQIDSITIIGYDTYTANGVSFDMVGVTGGSLYVGSSSTPLSEANNVFISDFFMGKTEVTQALWRAVMGSWTGGDVPIGIGNSNPVYNVSWNNIVGTGSTTGYTYNGVAYKTDGFCYKLSQLVGGGKQFRLPTAAEWEYAARGGQKTHGYTYSGSNNIDDVAWYNSNSSLSTHTVGGKTANELGLFDMSGNVWEWCSDWYGSTYPSSSNNPAGASSGSFRMFRGGGCDDDASICVVASRTYSGDPGGRYRNLGFRLVLVP